MAELVVLSSFDWSVPGTPEIISETASLGGIRTIHFTKPRSLISANNRTQTNLTNVVSKDLKLVSVRLSRFKNFEKFQNRLIVKQIIRSVSKHSFKKPNLIYTNLESISNILPILRPYFRNFYYICADYSEIDYSFHSNALHADKILTIPRSMIPKISDFYPKKCIHWPQMTTEFEEATKLNPKIEKILSYIPSPRAIYTGLTNSRIDAKLYNIISEALPEISFITFSSNANITAKKNKYQVPWLTKFEIFQLVKECQVGFMPYDISDLHNLHCVPLKLFEYFRVGIPVVSTKLINLDEYKPHVKLASNTKEFIEFLSKSIKNEKTLDEINARKEIAKYHTSSNLKDKLKLLLSK